MSYNEIERFATKNGTLLLKCIFQNVISKMFLWNKRHTVQQLKFWAAITNDTVIELTQYNKRLCYNLQPKQCYLSYSLQFKWVNKEERNLQKLNMLEKLSKQRTAQQWSIFYSASTEHLCTLFDIRYRLLKESHKCLAALWYIHLSVTSLIVTTETFDFDSCLLLVQPYAKRSTNKVTCYRRSYKSPAAVGLVTLSCYWMSHERAKRAVSPYLVMAIKKFE